MKDLKERTVRGGFAKLCSQIANFVLRLGSLMVMGRLLEPRDFGLVGMVTAVVGVLNIFRDFGLSTATIQREEITEDQLSTLFWINILVGAVLGLLTAAIAPFVASFYHEPRLVTVTFVMAVSFLFNAAGVQHSALLQRQMRFTTMAIIEVIALCASVGTGVGLALKGYGYWSLVAMTVATPLVCTVCYWITARWIPGRPHRHVGLQSMMAFGGTITLNGLIVYVAYNLEKVLLGRFWGAESVGLYGRAYQLINIPTENLNTAVGGVAFSALSRVQHDSSLIRQYFLKGYSLVVAMTVPVTLMCALFAGDMTVVVLGQKWKDAAILLRLLAPTIVVFAIINPLGWLMFALGKVSRSLRIALVLAPVVIVGYLVGLPYGPKGVALGYSAMLLLWLAPHVAWCVHGTSVSFRDIAVTVGRPLLSGVVAGLAAFGLYSYYGPFLAPLPRLLLSGTTLFAVYLAMLLFVMGQKTFYLGLLRGLRIRGVVPEEMSPARVS
jgi:O-antigen/teichoic acid export membrane protein